MPSSVILIVDAGVLQVNYSHSLLTYSEVSTDLRGLVLQWGALSVESNVQW